MSTSDLIEYNPWWKNEDVIEKDPEIQNWENSILKWNPRIRQTFQAEDFIYSLRGPRQVGKTTLVKLEIRDLLKVVPKWHVMYYSFELENSPRDVVNVINDYLTRAKFSKKYPRRFIYLDEISNVKDWQKAIKKLKDQGKLKGCTVIATGSHSIDLRHATELLPGRRGITSHETLDKILPPMKFGEYVPTIDKEIEKEIHSNFLLSSKHRFSIIRKLAEGEIDDSLLEIAAYQNELDKHLSNYLITGGIPTSIDAFLKNGSIEEGVYQIYLDAMTGDLRKAGRDVSYMTQLMPNIIDSLGTPTSWMSLKENSDMGSHHTVEDYVKILAEMFVLSVFYRFNAAENKPKFDGLKKIYLHDPFFLHAINGLISQKDPYDLSLKYLDNPKFQSQLIEQIVSDHCIRLAFNLTPKKAMFDYHSSVFYWKSSKTKREVDFIVRDNESLLPIEVKYQNEIKKDDYYSLIDFKKTTGIDKAIMLTKNDLREESEATLIPVSLFLLLV